MFGEPAAATRAVTAAAPTSAQAADTSRPAHVAGGAATPLAAPEQSKGGDGSAAIPAAAVTTLDTSAQSGSNSGSSPVLPLAVVIAALGIALAYAAVRLRHRHQRAKVEAFFHQQDTAWEAVVHDIELERSRTWERSTEQFEQADAA